MCSQQCDCSVFSGLMLVGLVGFFREKPRFHFILCLPLNHMRISYAKKLFRGQAKASLQDGEDCSLVVCLMGSVECIVGGWTFPEFGYFLFPHPWFSVLTGMNEFLRSCSWICGVGSISLFHLFFFQYDVIILEMLPCYLRDHPLFFCVCCYLCCSPRYWCTSWIFIKFDLC